MKDGCLCEFVHPTSLRALRVTIFSLRTLANDLHDRNLNYFDFIIHLWQKS